MLNQKELNKIEKGEEIDHFLLVKKFELKLTKAGKQYLSLELGDKSLSLSANVWDNFESILKNISNGSIVKVLGLLDEYQNVPQIKISSIRLLNESENVSPKDFLPVSTRDFEIMKNEFFERIEKITDVYLKALMVRVFNDNNFGKFSTAPAGKSWHHSYIHGLLEHTLEILKICDLMCDFHPELNRDLLISGAMLHDFGKIEELNFENSFEYSDKGKLLGHIVISAMFINEEIKNIPGFPEELKNCLIHLILSHQGKLEYASPVIPKTIEAIALYQADELSAKVNAYKNAISSIPNSENKWTKYISLASTDLYNHGLSSEYQIYHSDNDKKINKSLFD